VTRVGQATEYLLIRSEFRFFWDRLRILQSARDTDAGSLLGEYFASSGGNVPEHIHLNAPE
jgi:hypothetical protein